MASWAPSGALYSRHQNGKWKGLLYRNLNKESNIVPRALALGCSPLRQAFSCLFLHKDTSLKMFKPTIPTGTHVLLVCHCADSRWCCDGIHIPSVAFSSKPSFAVALVTSVVVSSVPVAVVAASKDEEEKDNISFSSFSLLDRQTRLVDCSIAMPLWVDYCVVSVRPVIADGHSRLYPEVATPPLVDRGDCLLLAP